MYTPEVGNIICLRIAEGESLRSICLDDGMPTKTTVMRWLQEEDKTDFRDQYTRARESQAEHYLDEIIEIADDCTDDVEAIISSQEGAIGHRIKQSAIQRARLQIDTRKWTMSKLAPKKYGDRMALAGDVDNPMEMKHSGKVELSPAETYLAMLNGKS